MNHLTGFMNGGTALNFAKDEDNRKTSSKAGLHGPAGRTSTPFLASLLRGLGSWRPAAILQARNAPVLCGYSELGCRTPNEMMMMMMMKSREMSKGRRYSCIFLERCLHPCYLLGAFMCEKGVSTLLVAAFCPGKFCAKKRLRLRTTQM